MQSYVLPTSTLDAGGNFNILRGAQNAIELVPSSIVTEKKSSSILVVVRCVRDNGLPKEIQELVFSDSDIEDFDLAPIANEESIV